MANALLQDLAAATTLAGTDLFYVKQAGARGVKATGTQLLALVGTAYVPLAGGTMTGALTLPAGAVGTPQLMFTGAGTTNGFYSSGANNISIAINGVRNCYFEPNATYIAGSSGLVIQNTSALLYFGLDGLLSLQRDAAATLAQRNGKTAQTLRVYGTYTDSSNYERLTLSTTAGSSVNIAAETLGTGADNLDIVLTPAGTGLVKFQAGSYVDANGTFYTAGTFVAGTTLWVGATLQLRMGNAIGALWSSTANANGTVDTGLNRGAAGQVDVTNGTAATYRDLKLRNLLNVEYHQMTEMTAPSAPATNSVRIYAEDNGSGKTRLMALFATGAAQQISIEP